MPLGDDDRLIPFATEIIAKRAADLATIAEETYETTKNDTLWKYRPAYVIGSEVPVPGGTQEDEEIQITKPDDLSASIICFRDAFLKNGLQQVWADVIAVVAQIGVEFSDETVHNYNHESTISLSAELRKYQGLFFESHSSDYQTAECLRQMVRDGVGILKVGPEATFKMREGLFALSMIEDELAENVGYQSSRFADVLEKTMLDCKPNYWEKYYHRTDNELKLKRKYSFSDRSRYYFSQSPVIASYKKLFENLSKTNIPLTLISQYLPEQYTKIREGKIMNSAYSILADKVQSVMDRYYSNMVIAKEEGI
jgi:D-tagatose-1,6-bisphosphate aldolase subunit GatZ/KbaZ